MGKSSRMKKVNRTAMADRPGFHQGASRQARERRQEEVNQHNAAFEATLEESDASNQNGPLFLSEEGPFFLTADGVRQVGEKEVKALYDTWIGDAIEKDDPEQLAAIAAMGPQFHTSIWASEVAIAYPHLDGPALFNPVMAAFMLDMSQCFAWLLEHAFSHQEESAAAMTEVLWSVLMNADKFKPGSDRLANTRLLIKATLDWSSDANRQAVADKMIEPGVGGMVAKMVAEYLGERAAKEEYCEIDSSVTPPVGSLLANGNPQAIELGQVAVNDPDYDGQSPGSATSGAKRL